MSAVRRPSDEDPRSRILRHGPESLSDAELVAVLLRSGTAGQSALDVAKELLRDHRNLRSLVDVSEGLQDHRGIGAVKAAYLLAAFEIACRVARTRIDRRKLLNEPASLAEYLSLRYPCPDQEILGAVLVDIKIRLIDEFVVFRGGLSRATVEPRQILRIALLKCAHGVIIWHSHPSGDPAPSSSDLEVTLRMAKACEFVGIRLVDHLILGSGGRWVSMQRREAW